MPTNHEGIDYGSLTFSTSGKVVGTGMLVSILFGIVHSGKGKVS